MTQLQVGLYVTCIAAAAAAASHYIVTIAHFYSLNRRVRPSPGKLRPTCKRYQYSSEALYFCVSMCFTVHMLGLVFTGSY